MTEERPQHTQEPAEGSDENVEAPAADKAVTSEGAGDESQAPTHPQEPAEGADEAVEAPGADR